MIAREVAERLRPGWGDDAFLAGLLADLGLLVLIQRLGEPFLKVVHRVRSANRDLAEVERHALGFDHVQLTVQLLRSWGLPDPLTEAIGCGKYEPSVDTGENAADGAARVKLGQVLRFAEQATRFLCDRQAGLLPRLTAMATGQFRFSDEAFDDLFGSLEETVKQLAQSLSLDLPDALQYTSILEDANRQLSGLATEMATDMMRRRGPQSDAPPDEYALWTEVRTLSRMAAELYSRSPADAEATASVNPATSIDGASRYQSAKFSAEPGEIDNNQDPIDDAKDAELLKTLGAAVKVCRKARLPLSVVLVEADRREPDKLTAAERAFWLEELGHLCHALEFPSKICVQVRVYALGPGVAGSRVAARRRNWRANCYSRFARERPGPSSPRLPSVWGLRQYPSLRRISRRGGFWKLPGSCLFGAQIAGNTIKSIEIF